MRRITNEELQRLVDLIPHADYGGQPIQAQDLATQLGIPRHTVYHQIARLKKVGVIRKDKAGNPIKLPLLPSVKGYVFSADPEHNRQFRYTFLKGDLTNIQNVYTETAEYFVKTLPAAQQDEVRRGILRLINRLIEDISDVVAMHVAPITAGTR